MRYNRESIPDSSSVLLADVDDTAVDDEQRRGARPCRTVLVTVDGDLPGMLPALREAGLHVERTLTAIGAVVGTVDRAAERAVRSLRGVRLERGPDVRAVAAVRAVAGAPAAR